MEKAEGIEADKLVEVAEETMKLVKRIYITLVDFDEKLRKLISEVRKLSDDKHSYEIERLEEILESIDKLIYMDAMAVEGWIGRAAKTVAEIKKQRH